MDYSNMMWCNGQVVTFPCLKYGKHCFVMYSCDVIFCVNGVVERYVDITRIAWQAPESENLMVLVSHRQHLLI